MRFEKPNPKFEYRATDGTRVQDHQYMPRLKDQQTKEKQAKLYENAIMTEVNNHLRCWGSNIGMGAREEQEEANNELREQFLNELEEEDSEEPIELLEILNDTAV